jgi:hypothetical protein
VIFLPQTEMGGEAGESINKNTLETNIRDGISTLSVEILSLQDELDDWPDGETRIITYELLVEQPDGSYLTVEKTEAMTGEQAKALVTSMEKEIMYLENCLSELGFEGDSGESDNEGANISITGTLTLEVLNKKRLCPDCRFIKVVTRIC